MKTSSGSKPWLRGPAFDHYVVIGELARRAKVPQLRDEAEHDLAQYRDRGIVIQEFKERDMAKQKKDKATPAAKRPHDPVFTGQGIMFAVIDDREAFKTGRTTTVDVIAEAIEKALDEGHETSEEIARYLTTSAFQHIADKRVRFNSVLKAGDVVGAQIIRKLMNAYNDLAQLADEEDDAKAKAELRIEATGFAEAVQIVLSPFSCEDPKDPRLVDWDTVDRITTNFEKEQRLVRRERKGNPQ